MVDINTIEENEEDITINEPLSSQFSRPSCISVDGMHVIIDISIFCKFNRINDTKPYIVIIGIHLYTA